MQGKHIYEYAVIRVVPRVEREEFMNIGIILFSKKANYIKTKYVINEEKLKCFTAEPDIDSLRNNLQSFDKICTGDPTGGYIASLEVHERFRWLTAIRSTSIQTSRPHPGFSSDLERTFNKLFEELVL